MVEDLQLIEELLELVDSKPLSKVDFAPILEKYEAGLDINEQRLIRAKISRLIRELKNNGDIDFVDQEVHISVSTAGVWVGKGGLIRSTLKRKEKLEQIERDKNRGVFNVGSMKDSTIIHGSDLRDSAITHSVTTTPKIKDAKTKWYTSTILIYLIYPLIVAVIAAYVIYRLGWLP